LTNVNGAGLGDSLNFEDLLRVDKSSAKEVFRGLNNEAMDNICK